MDERAPSRSAMERFPEPDPEPELAAAAAVAVVRGDSILARHLAGFVDDAVLAGTGRGVKECMAQLLSSSAEAEGAECERFVKRSAALIDNDRANPLLFIGTVKDFVAEVTAMLISHERVQSIAAAGSTTDPDQPDLSTLAHVALEFATVRPLLGRIMKVVRQAREKEEAFLKTQIQNLKTKEVAEFVNVDAARTIASRGMERAAWDPVVEVFNELQRPMLPSQVLQQLQRTVQAVRGVAEQDSCVLAERTVTQLLCFVVVQSSVQWLRSIHLIVTELSEPVVTTPGPTTAGTPTWCYRVFSNSLSEIEGMTVSLHRTGSRSPGSSSDASGGSTPRQAAKIQSGKNSVWRHFTTAAQDERLPNAPKWASDAEVDRCTGCAQVPVQKPVLRCVTARREIALKAFCIDMHSVVANPTPCSRPVLVSRLLTKSARCFCQPFGMMRRRHHCRHCGNVLCEQCTKFRSIIPHLQYSKPVRVCSTCFESIKLVRDPPTGQPAAEAAIERLLDDKRSNPGNAVRNYISIFDERIRPTPATAGVATREVMDAVRQMILDENRESLLESTLQQTEDEAPWIREENLTRLINTILEKRLFLPLRSQLLNCLTQVHYQDEIKLEESLILVRGRPQDFFGIARKNQSNWAAAISHFNQIGKEIYPSRMVAALLSCAKVRASCLRHLSS